MGHGKAKKLTSVEISAVQKTGTSVGAIVRCSLQQLAIAGTKEQYGRPKGRLVYGSDFKV